MSILKIKWRLGIYDQEVFSAWLTNSMSWEFCWFGCHHNTTRCRCLPQIVPIFVVQSKDTRRRWITSFPEGMGENDHQNQSQLDVVTALTRSLKIRGLYVQYVPWPTQWHRLVTLTFPVWAFPHHWSICLRGCKSQTLMSQLLTLFHLQTYGEHCQLQPWYRNFLLSTKLNRILGESPYASPTDGVNMVGFSLQMMKLLSKLLNKKSSVATINRQVILILKLKVGETAVKIFMNDPIPPADRGSRCRCTPCRRNPALSSHPSLSYSCCLDQCHQNSLMLRK